MVNIVTKPEWSPVRQLETSELARGGLNGNLNEHALALANRTELLMQEKAAKSEIVQGHYEYGTYADFNAAKSSLPLNCTIIINEVNNTGTGSWVQGSNRWNGTTLVKSEFNPLIQANNHSENLVNKTLEFNRKRIKTTTFATINYFRNADGTTTNDNLTELSAYITVKAGDVIDYNVYARLNRPVIIWCDPTKTTFSRLDNETSGSTAELKTGKVTVAQDGFITVNNHLRSATEKYFYSYLDEKLFVRPEQINTVGGVADYDTTSKALKDINSNRAYTKVNRFTKFYLRVSNGTLKQSNAWAYSDYVPVKAGDVIEVNVYAQFNWEVVVWCDPTKTTFSRLDSIGSGSTAELKTAKVTVLQDGYITVNTALNSYADNYFYAFLDEKLFIRPNQINATGGILGYDLGTKLLKDTAQNRSEETRKYDDLTWSGGNGTDLANDGAWMYRHTPFIEVRAGDIINFGAYQETNNVSGYVSVFSKDNRNTILKNVVISARDANKYGENTFVIDVDGWITLSTLTNLVPDLSKIYLTTFTKKMYLPHSRKTSEITVFGDSLSQGLGNALASTVNTSEHWHYKINQNGVGGENVLDTSFRSGAINLWVKGGFTIPASSASHVQVDARWLFNENYAIDADGVPIVNARNITNPAGSFISYINGIKVYINKISSDTFNRAIFKISFVDTQSSDLTISDHQVLTCSTAGQKSGVGVLMMGTNGGMLDYGQNQNDRAWTKRQLDEMIQLIQRNIRLFQDQRVMVCGWHGVFTNTFTDPDTGEVISGRAYYRKKCQQAFGERFVDLPSYLISKGLTDMKISLNANEVAFIQAQDGVTNGTSGNTFLPIYSGDATHCRSIVYQAYTNHIIKRMNDLGWISDLPQKSLTFISDLTVASTASIGIGATTIGTATYTDPINGSDIFEWTSSNPAVATVTNKSWLNDWTTRKTTTITGVSAGTAIITCKCRFGGATASFVLIVN